MKKKRNNKGKGEYERRKRYRNRNYHHLTPRSRGGDYTTKNLLLIDRDRHSVWHRLFGNKTLEEVIELLIRLSRMKRREHECENLYQHPRICRENSPCYS